MKAVSLASRVLAAVLGVLTFALLFFGIVHVVSSQGTFELSATQLAFGSKLTKDSAGSTLDLVVDLCKSAWYFFTFFIALLGAICAVASLKSEKSAVGALVFGIINVIMMLLFICNTPGTYVDHRPLSGIKEIWYNNTFIALLCVSIAFVVFMIASILLADYIKVKESNGAKKFLLVRFKAWLLEYKSEIKRITWPNFNTVVKNTLIVLIMCAVVGAFIWIEDFGLAKLLELVFHS